MPVISMKPDGQLQAAVMRSRIGLGVGPLAKGRLDEALGLAIGLWSEGLGPHVFEAEIVTGLGEGASSVAGTVVGHDASHGDAKAGIIGDSSREEGDRALLGGEGPQAYLDFLGGLGPLPPIAWNANFLAPASRPIFTATAQTGAAVAFDWCNLSAAQRGMLDPGMNVLLAAFGAGFTWGAGVIEWAA